MVQNGWERSQEAIQIVDNALVGLPQMIDENRPGEKRTIIKVIVSLINRSYK